MDDHDALSEGPCFAIRTWREPVDVDHPNQGQLWCAKVSAAKAGVRFDVLFPDHSTAVVEKRRDLPGAVRAAVAGWLKLHGVGESPGRSP